MSRFIVLWSLMFLSCVLGAGFFAAFKFNIVGDFAVVSLGASVVLSVLLSHVK